VLAVLAVATPCPLILATPVAILGGINRAARRQIILRHGTALEQIGATTVAIFDKTGTITLGLPRVRRVITPAAVDADKVLRLAAGVERASGHLLARTLVQHAADSGFDVPAVRSVSEAPGRGVVGEVAGHDVAVGARSYVLELHPAILRELEAIEPPNHGLFAYVAVDGRLGGIVEYADELRAEARDVLGALERLGIRRTILLSGDREANARAVAASVGIREVRGDLLPEDKVTAVRALVAGGDRVLMVGDGTNDAPALGVATVGVALAGHGGGITAEAADIVILTDDLRRVVEAIEISRRTMRIARQSIWVGLGMSGVAMLAAAAGFIAPAVGALIQEGIDLAVIVNALRASREPRARQAAATLRQPISDAVAVVRR
jgi:P-type E1-E2 ATPase